MTISGFSFAGRGQNMGMAFVMLKDWKLRKSPELRAPAVARRAMGAFSRYRDGHGVRLRAAAGRRTGAWPTASTSSSRTAAASAT